MSRRFDISERLLAQDKRGWTNLGDWQHTHDYANAAEALARRVGRAAGLIEGAASTGRLLELAIGHGAGLRLWHHTFGIHALAGIDLRPDAVFTAQTQIPDAVRHTTLLACASFDTGRLPEAMPAGSFDHVVCVDAAYHARSAQAFLATARQAMAPGARLGFSTLVTADGAPRTWLLRQGLALADIPEASLLSGAGWRQAMTDAGLRLDLMDDATTAVLGGFSAFVTRRAACLSPLAKRQPAWWKIAATGQLCGRLAHGQSLRYVVVGATAISSGA
jgi:2-polyprenyl-3-methyl-5-hydroxy-6-metoxy-1,4-benzoquinol methylase